MDDRRICQTSTATPAEPGVLEVSNIVPLRQPTAIDDPLTNILRTGARQLLAQAVEVEAETFLAKMKDLKLALGD
jgi:putative transposase